MTIKKISYNLPEISYKKAMHLYLDGLPLHCCNPSRFAEAIERLVAASYDPVSLREDLKGHNYTYRVDRWHGLLVLEQHGVKFSDVFKTPPE